jgi:hypothetical protein
MTADNTEIYLFHISSAPTQIPNQGVMGNPYADKTAVA